MTPASDREDIDHDYTDDVVCPYCGNSHDSTEFRADNVQETSYDCDECGKEFIVTMNIEVTFSTERKKAPHA